MLRGTYRKNATGVKSGENMFSESALSKTKSVAAEYNKSSHNYAIMNNVIRATANDLCEKQD